MLPQDFGQLTWQEVRQAIDADYIVLLPVGSIEQHGLALPVDSDDHFALRWSAEAARKARTDYGVPVLVLPGIHYGDSTHHSHFPGTISLQPETLCRLVEDILNALVTQGFRRIVVVNVHGGNRPAVEIAIRKVKQRCVQEQRSITLRLADDSHRDILPPAFWEQAVQMSDEAAVGHMLHGGALEASKLLDDRASLVHLDRVTQVVPPQAAARPDVRFYHELTPTGAIGDPMKANTEAGRLLWQYLVDGLVDYLRHI